MHLLQYDERLFRPEQKDETLRHPTQDIQLVPFQLIHKDQIPIFPNHTIRLHENPREINEFQNFLANSKKVFLGSS